MSLYTGAYVAIYWGLCRYILGTDYVAIYWGLIMSLYTGG